MQTQTGAPGTKTFLGCTKKEGNQKALQEEGETVSFKNALWGWGELHCKLSEKT